jgi:radical SAM superfamily enzyme YgiQ (UPF0313 family)
MAALLRDAGHQVHLVDYPAIRAGVDRLREDIAAFRPDHVIFTSTAPTLDDDLRLAKQVKTWNPDVVVTLKGEPANFLDEELLNNHWAIDYVFRGEAEGIVKAYAAGVPIEKIPGVTWRRDGAAVRNPAPAKPMDLDDLPFPARDLLDSKRYIWPETGDIMTTVLTSQGCPYECIFCAVVPVKHALSRSADSRVVRFRSAQSIVGELRECIETFGIRHFLFHADTFTLRRQWVVELCQAILDAGLSIEWAANSRVDTIDEERLGWMRRAGCRIVGFGVETGNDEHLRLMGKYATADNARRAIRLCREYGIKSHAFFVLGFPWDTEESIRDTVEFALELNPDFFDFNLVYPIPGTPLYYMVTEEGLCDIQRLNRGGYSVAAVRTRTVSADRLEQLRRRALWRLYLRSGYVIRTLRGAGSLRIAWRYCRAAITRVANLLLGL